MTDHIIQTHTCVTCGGYGHFSEKNARGETIWHCGYRNGQPVCTAKGKR